MTTIEIDKQESAAALCEAFAAALAEKIGWTADGVSVKKDGINVYFTFVVSGSNVYISVSNGYAAAQGTAYQFATSNTYKLYVAQTTGGTIAVGGAASTATPALSAVIARNTAGVYVGWAIANNATNIRGIETSTRSMNIAFNNNAGCSTSIVKLPDIWGACMFSDLYLVVSCPYSSTDCTFYIGGTYYRVVGSSSYKFAIPEV